jgi:retron-type reverse transcriptase
MLRVLEQRFERLFLRHSYGYRPGRSVADAVRQVVVLREKGLSF